MSKTRLRMIQYYLNYARQHRDDWQALDGAQFTQIQRAWRILSAATAELETVVRAQLMVSYLNAMDDYLEKRGLWQESLDWTKRTLDVAPILQTSH